MAGLKFRVLLDSDQNQEIFRDIVVDDKHTYEALYQEIMRSFGFKGNQMASFYVSNDDWDKGHEISWMDLSFGDEQEEATPSVMATTMIADFITEPDQKLILVYDFMRMWIFLIELIGYEKESPANPETIFSVGNSPDEDSKQMQNEAFEGDDMMNEEEEDDDDFGFDSFDDGFDEEDMGNFEEFDY